ncbi:unnamed protein product [Rotaria socialis]|uniref:Aprataxin and PNK-like factor n=2 Tax=Rotaria socialis TaxID=392032 RepID=A0A818BC71_9BILA|nr:unnamed protein product [Rotaria socialis]
MSTVELIPLDKGNRLILDDTTVTTIGRTANIGCTDKKISRNHAELNIKSDGTLWIKPIHHNPTFYRTKTNQLTTLTKDQEFQLNDNDEIGLLPNEYFYRISIKQKDEQETLIDSSTVTKSPIHHEEEEEEEHIEPSAISKSPIQQEENSSRSQSPVKDKSPTSVTKVQPEGGIILHTTRALPAWMSTSSVPETKSPKGRGSKGKQTTTPVKASPSPSKYRTYIGRKKSEGVVYDDDDEESNEEPAKKVTPPTVDQVSSKVTNPVKPRERCPYGKFCYRKNPAHLQENIHPGDPDWNNKENDSDDKKPQCPYGTDCYRKNPGHLKEYSHTQKRSSINTAKPRTSKRKGSDDEDDDDDDGLPNEYDYNDSFLDDEDIDDSARVDRTGVSEPDPDRDWKPRKKIVRAGADDDDEDISTDESEIELLKNEAAEFVQGSSVNQQRPAKKKARMSMSDEDD